MLQYFNVNLIDVMGVVQSSLGYLFQNNWLTLEFAIDEMVSIVWRNRREHVCKYTY